MVEPRSSRSYDDERFAPDVPSPLKPGRGEEADEELGGAGSAPFIAQRQAAVPLLLLPT